MLSPGGRGGVGEGSGDPQRFPLCSNQPRTPWGSLWGRNFRSPNVCHRAASRLAFFTPRSTAGLWVPLHPTDAGDGAEMWDVGRRCAASPLRGNGLLISTKIGVLSSDCCLVCPRLSHSSNPCSLPPTLPFLHRAERAGKVPNFLPLLLIPPAKKKKSTKKPQPSAPSNAF